MEIFHLIAVAPVDVAPHEVPRVRYAEFMLHAETIAAAFEAIRHDLQVAAACEVWGAPIAQLNLTPSSRLEYETTTEEHHHWVRLQDTYTVVHRGAESLEAWSARRFEEYLSGRVARHLREAGVGA